MKKNNKLLKHLFSLQQGDYKFGLERITEMLQFIDNPQNNYPTIHVAGTNGKGSVCCLLASILQESGLKVGLYTSPHIFEFHERIRVNGVKISDSEIEEYYAFIEDKAAEIGSTFFEITTAIAFKHFEKYKVDIAIIETGLGGRLDSTNVMNPILSIITTIDTDHEQILGNSIEKIAKEKAAIIKENVPVIVQYSDLRAMDVIQNRVNELCTQMFLVDSSPIVDLKGFASEKNMIIDIHLPTKQNLSNTIISNLMGFHQMKNIAVAIFAINLLYYNSVGRKSIVKGIERVTKNTGLRFRTECISENPKIIIDVAHNSQSIGLLVTTLKEISFDTKWNFVFGVMKDKNISKMLSNLMEVCNELIVVSPNIERAATIEEIAETAKILGFKNILKFKSIKEAMNYVKKSNEQTIICGSFYVVEQAAQALGINKI